MKRSTLEQNLDRLWSRAQQGAHAVAKAVEDVAPAELTGAVAVAGAVLGHAGTSVFEDVRSLGREVASVPGRVKSLVVGVGHALTINSNLEALRPNDTYTLTASANASYPGLKALGRGNLDVRRKADGTFVVGVTAEVLAGLFGMTGVQVGGAGAGIEGLLAPGVGGRVEMSFQNVRDAERAVHALTRETGHGTLLSGSSGDLDHAFLKQHLSAVELRGSLTAETKSRLGLGTDAIFSGIFGIAGTRHDEVLRLEFPPGHTPALVLKSAQSAELGAQLSFMQSGRSLTYGSRTGAGVTGRGSAMLEQRFDLPSDFSLGGFLHHPTQAWSTVTRALGAHESYRLTLSFEAGAQVLQNGKGLQDKLVVENDGHAPLALKDVLAAYFTGHGERVAERLTREVPGAQVDYARQPFQQAGFGLTPEVRVMGFGIGTELGAIRRNLQAPAIEFHHDSPVASEFS